MGDEKMFYVSVAFMAVPREKIDEIMKTVSMLHDDFSITVMDNEDD